MKKRKIEYVRFNVEEIYDPNNLQTFPLLNKLFQREKTLKDEKVCNDLCAILYGSIKKICGRFSISVSLTS